MGMEVALLVVGMVYMAFYLIRTATFGATARKVHAELEPVLQREFESCGDADGRTLIQESAHEYAMYAQGHPGCLSLTAMLTLPPSHDLYTAVTSCVLLPAPDVLRVTVRLAPGSTPPCVLGIAPRRTLKALLASAADIAQLTTRKPQEGPHFRLPAALGVYAEDALTENALMAGPIAARVAELAGVLDLIHISDQYVPPKPAPVIKLAAAPEEPTEPVPPAPCVVVQLRVPSMAAPEAPSAAAAAELALALAAAVCAHRPDEVRRAERIRRRQRVAAKEEEGRKSLAAKEAARLARERKAEKENEERARYEAMDESSSARLAWEKKEAKKADKKQKKMMMRRVVKARA